jgi:DNA-binding SARP family transcriptional activator/tetratricopeptide (TPR) repeat protein
MSEIEGSIRFEVLGPIRVRIGDSEITISAKRDRIMLAMLLLHAPDPVPLSRLVEAIWDDQPPHNSRNQVHGCVSRWRKRFADAGVQQQMIMTDQAGYQIPVELPDLDLLEFRRLRDEARSAAANGRPMEAYERYRAALGLWRGPALAGIDSSVVRRAAAALDEEHVQVQEECLRLALEHDLGGPGVLTAEIASLVGQHPFREALQAALLRALYRAGRQADALAAYRDYRERLNDELGTEPGDELQRLHRAVLNRDPQLDAPRPSPPAPATAAAPAPRELPAQVPGFTGRADALATLDDLVSGQSAGAPGPVVISAIAGTAGVGKTALAVHWAHRVADQFPDGQLYLNLRGYASGPPVRPIEALAALLRSLGVPSDQIPTDQDQAAALLRTRLADRRVLLVLDNARSVDQVRPLLPGSPSCLVLVTSRNRLSGLAARDGARKITLDVLTPDEARALLRHMLGVKRVEAEPGATADLAAACAHLPLALRIAAACIVDHPTRTIASYITELTTGDRLATLQADGDQESSVLAALDLSYQALPPETARLFRLLGFVPGPSIDHYAAAALTGTTLLHTSRSLDQLLGAHLLQEPTPGRFVFHDLVRAHARHTAATIETESQSQTAMNRLLDHYRLTASMAAEVAYPREREPRPLDTSRTDSPAPDVHDPAVALEWLDTELPNLLATTLHAVEAGLPRYVVQMSEILDNYLRSRGRYLDAEFIHYRALTSARSYGDRAGELAALVALGGAHRLQDRHEQAVDDYQQALELARTVGDRHAQLDALIGLANGYLMQDSLGQAFSNLQQALAIARTVCDHRGQSYALNGLGHVHLRQRHYREARKFYQQALEIARTASNRGIEASALTGLGRVHLREGRHQDAREHYQQALEVARAAGHRTGQLGALAGLGDAYRQKDEHSLAADHYKQLLRIAQELGTPNWQFEAMHGLGRLHQASGHPESALANHQQALDLAIALRQRIDQARAHDGLAEVYCALNQLVPARQHWQHALDILVALGIDYAETSASAIRTHLKDLDGQQNRSGEPT